MVDALKVPVFEEEEEELEDSHVEGEGQKGYGKRWREEGPSQDRKRCAQDKGLECVQAGRTAGHG